MLPIKYHLSGSSSKFVPQSDFEVALVAISEQIEKRFPLLHLHVFESVSNELWHFSHDMSGNQYRGVFMSVNSDKEGRIPYGDAWVLYVKNRNQPINVGNILTGKMNWNKLAYSVKHVMKLLKE